MRRAVSVLLRGPSPRSLGASAGGAETTEQPREGPRGSPWRAAERRTASQPGAQGASPRADHGGRGQAKTSRAHARGGLGAPLRGRAYFTHASLPLSVRFKEKRAGPAAAWGNSGRGARGARRRQRLLSNHHRARRRRRGKKDVRLFLPLSPSPLRPLFRRLLRPSAAVALYS